MAKYNGWTNYETWNVNLWAVNDEGIYRWVQKNKPYSVNKARRVAEELFPEGTADMDNPSDMDKVNWREIATAWNED